MEAHDELDRWLDSALADYGNVHPPLGFETRTIARMQSAGTSLRWLGPLVLASAGVAALLLFSITHILRNVPPAPAPLRAAINVPMVQHLVTDRARVQPVARTTPASLDPRGVPLVQAPLSRQEEALLSFSRYASARQIATLVRPPETNGIAPLHVDEIEIPLVMKEGEQ